MDVTPQFFSTRGESGTVSFTKAVELGLAPDGGLFLPSRFPDLKPRLLAWESLSYPELASAFFRLFVDRDGIDSLDRLTAEAYAGFDHPDIAPIVRLDEGLRVLELFHGPTLAFKDFALQLLGGFYEEQIWRTGRPIAVLGATSGDTGAAAIHGLLNREGVDLFILYPKGRISPLQERQMTCTGSASVHPLSIVGSFDDAQAALKELFSDHLFRDEVGLSAINSINLARILAQSVYYLYAWFRLPANEREQTRFVVPTGNFGNVLAGWMLKRMGVPMGDFVVATNQNDILHRFFQSGEYRRGEVHPSVAPSMDIQVASNFERFLYFLLGEDSAKVRDAMRQFKNKGRLDLSGTVGELGIRSTAATDSDIRGRIAEAYRRWNYVVDPHTACGFMGLDRDHPHLLLATAHPAKFPDLLQEVIGVHPRHPQLEALLDKPQVRYEVEGNASAIADFIREKRQSRLG